MAVPRFLLPQGQGCGTQPATIELIPAWCLEILPHHWIPSWNTCFKGLWTAADKLKLGFGFFFFFRMSIKNFSSLQLFSCTGTHGKLRYTESFPKRKEADPAGKWECCACMQPFLRESCLFTSLCHPLFISKANYFLLLLFPRRKVFFPIF